MVWFCFATGVWILQLPPLSILLLLLPSIYMADAARLQACRHAMQSLVGFHTQARVHDKLASIC